MNKQKMIIAIILIIIISANLFNSVFASNKSNEAKISINFSEDFKKWEKLSDDEKNRVIMPNITTNKMNQKDSNKANSMLFGMQNLFAKATIPSKYSLTDDINIPVKNQGITSECWAFSMTSTLESYLAKTKPNTTIPRYSERFMDYATTKTFTDGTNTKGFNRELKIGGNIFVALAYLTNGTGAVLEKDMPFENNENKISLSEIQNKKSQTRVTNAIILPNINKIINTDGNVEYVDDSSNKYTSEEVTLIRNKIKQHIMEYGALSATTVANQATYYNDQSNPTKSKAYYCNNNIYTIDHAITIVGWDDNYSVDNFNPNNKPKNPGAYLCLNSYGTDSFDKGYIYISYDDVNIEKNLAGIDGTEDITSDQKIYQNDFYGANLFLDVGNNGNSSEEVPLGEASVFKKDGNSEQYVDQVQVASYGNANVEIYINPNGASLEQKNLVKANIESNKLEGSYNTFKLKKPIKITGDTYAVVVKLTSNEVFKIGIECNLKDAGIVDTSTIYDCITANPGESFITTDNFKTWVDFTSFKAGEYNFKNSNLCIKAITTTNVKNDDNTNTNNNSNTDTNTNTSNNANTDTNTNTSNNANTDTNTNTSNNANTDTNTNTNNNSNTDTNTNTNTNNNTNTDTNTNINNNTNTDINTNTNNNTNTDTDANMNLNNFMNIHNSNENTNLRNSNLITSNTPYYYNGTADKTVANKLLPKTGSGTIRILIPIIGIIVTISYFNYRKYKDIKNK